MGHDRRDWARFALLPVDVQRSFWPGCVAPDFPDFPADVARLLSLCRSEGLEVIHVRSSHKPDKSDWILCYRNPFLDRRYALDREQFKPVLDEFYVLHGWDSGRGWPTRERLHELGVEDMYDPMVDGAERKRGRESASHWAVQLSC